VLSILAPSGGTPAAAGDAPPPNQQAAQLYLQAVRVMQALPQPPFATYTSIFTGEKTGFAIERARDGKASFLISTGGPSPGAVPTAYRSSDRMSAFVLKDGPAHTISPLGDPTWAGAAAFARYGIAPPDVPTPATPAPAATAGSLPQIGGVSVFSVAFYNVSDSGAATCPDGTPGERLHLIAYREPNTHPLTDAIVEDGTQRICSMQFKLHINGALSYAPVVELHFAQQGAYYLSTDGFIDGDVHLLALSVKHTHVRIERTAFAFPDTIPDATFTGP
jgi:hypothetical protein